jgi:hypothetical protein
MVTIASMVASTARALRFTERLGFAATAHLRLYSLRVAGMIRSLSAVPEVRFQEGTELLSIAQMGAGCGRG